MDPSILLQLLAKLRNESSWGLIMCQMKHTTEKSQHRFIQGKLCLTDLVAFYDTVTCSVDAG